MRLVEETEAHVIIGLLLLLSGGGGSGRGVTTGSGGSGGSSSGVGIGVSDAVLELLNALPGVVSLNSDGKDLLVGVDERVHGSRDSGEADGQGDGGDGLDGLGEGLQESLLGDVEDLSGESLTLTILQSVSKLVCALEFAE